MNKSAEYNDIYDVTYPEKSKEEVIKAIETINLDENGNLPEGLTYYIMDAYYITKNNKLMEVQLSNIN